MSNMHKKGLEMHKKSAGFSLITLLMAVVVLAGAGFAGWYVWEQDHKNPNNSSTKTSTSTKQSTPKKDATTTTKYLVIKEWGVKIPLSSEIEDAYYTLDVQQNAQYAQIYDKGFDNLKNSDGMSCADTPYQIYSIGRTTPANVAAASDATEPAFKTFSFTNDYLFNGLGAHQSAPDCLMLNDGTQDSAISNAENAKEKAFDAAFQGMVAQ